MCDICTPRTGRKEDHFTNTPEDAARYERMMAMDDGPRYDDPPTRMEAERDEA